MKEKFTRPSDEELAELKESFRVWCARRGIEMPVPKCHCERHGVLPLYCSDGRVFACRHEAERATGLSIYIYKLPFRTRPSWMNPKGISFSRSPFPSELDGPPGDEPGRDLVGADDAADQEAADGAVP